MGAWGIHNKDCVRGLNATKDRMEQEQLYEKTANTVQEIAQIEMLAGVINNVLKRLN